MIRFLRALAWMRWRSLVNALSHSATRDTLGRLALVTEKAVPVILGLMLVPSTLGLGAFGVFAGLVLGGRADDPLAPLITLVLRLLTGGMTVLAVFAPLVFSAGGQSDALVRLQLLPVPRRTIYVSEVVTRLADPWIAVFVPMLLLVPAGLLIAGRPVPAVLAAAAGLMLLAVLAIASTLVSSLLHLVARNRRRGELLALVFTVVMTMVSIIPAIVGEGFENRVRRSRAEGVNARPEGERRRAPAGWVWGVPSEMYVASIARAGAPQTPTATLPLLVLIVSAIALDRVAASLHRRLMETPEPAGRRRAGGRSREWRLPGVSPPVAAVASCQVRLILRTVKGKVAIWAGIVPMIILSTGAFALPFDAQLDATSLAIFGGFLATLALQSLAVNQFADHGAGLTFEFLAPLSDAQLVRGRLLGNALVTALSIVLYATVPLIMHPTANLVRWFTVVVGALSVFLLTSPFAALLAAIFPRHVNLSSIGRAGNPNQFATLLGLLASVVAALPPIGLAFLGIHVLHSDVTGLSLVFTWTLLAAMLAILLVDRVAPLVGRRREVLAATAEGRG